MQMKQTRRLNVEKRHFLKVAQFSLLVHCTVVLMCYFLGQDNFWGGGGGGGYRPLEGKGGGYK